jgi:hypothetical protein
MNLQKVSSAVAEHLAESDSDQFQVESAKDLRRLAVRRVLWGMALMFAGIAVSIIGKKLIHDEQVGVVGALISIVGMFLTGYFSLSAFSNLTLTERRSAREAKSYEAKTTAQLPPERLADVPFSIAERTTDLLASTADQSAERKRSDELKV